MKTSVQKNLIVISLGFFIILSFSFLAYSYKNQADLDLKKNWWVLYFENPKNNSVNFVIENHSDVENFRWEAYLEKNRTHDNNIIIPKGDKKVIQISSDEIRDKKIIIKVSNGSESREIYKIISN